MHACLDNLADDAFTGHVSPSCLFFFGQPERFINDNFTGVAVQDGDDTTYHIHVFGHDAEHVSQYLVDILLIVECPADFCKKADGSRLRYDWGFHLLHVS